MSADADMISKYACASVNHKRAPVDLIESVFFDDVKRGLLELKGASGADEVVLVQTCNRVEAYTYSEDPRRSLARVIELFESRAERLDVERHIEAHVGEGAAEHLFRVATSLDSMAVGEQEILGQISEALSKAVEAGTAGPYLKTLFEKALVTGKRARTETEISKGPVSLAHAAVDMAEEMTELTKSTVLVVGAGKAGRLLASSLRAHGAKNVVILNRTYERAVKLAEKYGFEAAPLTELRKYLSGADVVFVATAAPHYLIGAGDLKERGASGELLIFDLSNPRNVDPSVAELPAVRLKCLDDLREVTERNRLKRLREVEKVERIIREEISSLRSEIRKLVAEECLKGVLARADEIRRRELERAIRLLGCEKCKPEVLEAMTRSIVSKILSPVIEAAKSAAIRGDLKTVSLISKVLSGGERP